MTRTQPTWQTDMTQQTRPTRPTRPVFTGMTDDRNNHDDDDGDNNNSEEYNADESWYGDWNGWYAVGVPAVNAKIAAAVAEFIALESEAENTAVSGTTYTTTVSETLPPELSVETRRVPQKKVFDKKTHAPVPPSESAPSSIEHFVIFLDKQDNVTEVQGTEDFTEESCALMLQEIEPKDKYDGYYGSMQYVRKDYTQGAVMVFSDRQSDIKMLKTILFVSIGLFLLMELAVFFITRVLTKRAMRPMQISYEKQQQFISDAGHELKTPLTVISANADILADEIGDNKWLTYIKGQAERMRILVQEMLDLTKITNSDQHIAQSRFNISSLVENVALPFECQAFEQKKTFHIELEPEVEFFGNTERIRRMVGIFVDNAFKYSNENGTVKVQLRTESGKKVLRIYNTGIGIAKGEEEKIFERFYRSDSSRSKQGGYGLGLAIAKSIADQHGIKIQVQTEPGQWISFNLTL
ncbi:MAG: HAMP domain-containing histidine kinase, partial [Oscillospiraceae bacterium]|nr:HAMP domain-containing histidine kinase [Oscillospiraceae bacterium]